MEDVFPFRPDGGVGPVGCDPDAPTLAASAKCSGQCPTDRGHYRADLRGCVATQCARTTVAACATDGSHRRACPDECEAAHRRGRAWGTGAAQRGPSRPRSRDRKSVV